MAMATLRIWCPSHSTVQGLASLVAAYYCTHSPSSIEKGAAFAHGQRNKEKRVSCQRSRTGLTSRQKSFPSPKHNQNKPLAQPRTPSLLLLPPLLLPTTPTTPPHHLSLPSFSHPCPTPRCPISQRKGATAPPSSVSSCQCQADLFRSC